MSQAVIGSLRVNLAANTAAFDAAMRGVSGRAKAAVSGIRKAMAPLSAISVGVGGMGVSIARTAGAFEASMNRVQALSGATKTQFSALEDQAKELGRTTQFSASQAAEAMGFLAMAGFNAEQTLGAMPGTLQLAASAQMDLADAADIVSNVLTGFQKPVAELAAINDTLVKTMTSSNTDLRQLGDAFKYVGPVAAAAKVDFNETAAAIGLLGNAGIQGEMGGTALRGAITKILSPSKEAAGVMRELGVKMTDATGNILPLADVLDQLAPHADNAGAFMEIFGQRAGPAMLALVSQGSGALRDLTAELEGAGGTAQRIAETQMQGFNGQMKAMASAFEGFQIALADTGFLDVITQVVQKITEITQSMAKADPTLLKFGTVFAGITAAIAPVAAGIGLLVAAISAPTVGIIVAMAAATAAFVTFRDEAGGPFAATVEKAKNALDAFREKFPALSSALAFIGGILKSDLALAVGFARAAVESAVTAMGVAFEGIKATVIGVVKGIDALLSGDLGRAGEAAADVFRALYKTVIGVLDALFSDAVRKVGEIASGIVGGLRDGITAKIESVKAAIAGVGSSIIATFKSTLGINSPSTVFAEFGGWLMEGLLSGLRAKLAAVKDAIGGVGSSVAGWFRARLGINSPSTVFREIGGHIIDGLRLGIADNAQAIQPEMQRIGDVMSGVVGEIGGEISGTLKTALQTGKLDFKSFGDAIVGIGKRMSDRMIDQAFQPLETAIDGLVSRFLEGFGTIGSGAAPGGGATGGLGDLFGSLLSFDGGGFTGHGIRAGGLDGRGGMPALVHPNETIIDHTRGQGLAAPNVEITINRAGPDTTASARIKPSTQRSARQGNQALNSGNRYR